MVFYVNFLLKLIMMMILLFLILFVFSFFINEIGMDAVDVFLYLWIVLDIFLIGSFKCFCVVFMMWMFVWWGIKKFIFFLERLVFLIIFIFDLFICWMVNLNIFFLCMIVCFFLFKYKCWLFVLFVLSLNDSMFLLLLIGLMIVVLVLFLNRIVVLWFF